MMGSRILVKCGGFATQLAKYVCGKINDDPLWSSRYDLIDPDAVLQTYMDFLQNGADVIVTNTYQSSLEGFMQHLNLNEDDSRQLMRKSVQLAKESIEKYLKQYQNRSDGIESPLPLIMGSIGPYAAVLHDGSEYHGSYSGKINKKQLQEWHRPRIEILIGEGVSGLAIETIPCYMEAEAIIELLLTDFSNVNFWLTFQCKDDLHLAHGEHFPKAVYSIWKMVTNAKAESKLYGIGVNCVHPKFVAPLFKSLHFHLNDNQSTSCPPLVVYSNSGEIYNPEKGEWMDSDKCIPLVNYVPDWIELGAKIIGGCCRVYPNDILAISNCIKAYQ